MTQIAWTQHLILAPIVLPLVIGAVLILINESRHQLKFAINLLSTIALAGFALAIMLLADGEYWQDGIGVYLSANWAAPFGIALLADRLAAVMLFLTAIIGIAALVFSMQRWSRVGVHFHSLFQLLLMGLNGAFLTNDLFNLFVFFEVMLAASYGLVLHGYKLKRVRAGMQYIAINLIASFLFLIGVALIYAASGTLNLADLGGRVPGLEPDEQALLKAGTIILALAFVTKGAMWPLGFWLPTTYAAASPPVAAMLVLMTKVGVYAVLRLWMTAYSGVDNPMAGFGFEALLWGGIATLVFGSIGMFASQEPERMAGYGAIMSSGVLLAIVGFNQPALLATGLFYLLGSTLAMGAFMLLIELVNRIRTPESAMLALTMEAFAIEDTPEDPVGVGIPATLAFLGLAFIASALVITGMPPLSGFVAKFSMFHVLLNPIGFDGAPISAVTWLLIALVIASGLFGIIALMRFGVRTFWAPDSIAPPRLMISEAAPIAVLLLLCAILTVQAGPTMNYLERSTSALNQPEIYADRVLSEPPVERAPVAGDQP